MDLGLIGRDILLLAACLPLICGRRASARTALAIARAPPPPRSHAEEARVHDSRLALRLASLLAPLLLILSLPVGTFAEVLLNEVLADPITDWSGDGIIDFKNDEWIEIANGGSAPSTSRPTGSAIRGRTRRCATVSAAAWRRGRPWPSRAPWPWPGSSRPTTAAPA